MYYLALECVCAWIRRSDRIGSAEPGAEDDVLDYELAFLLDDLASDRLGAEDGGVPFVRLRVLGKGGDGRGRPDV